MNEDFSDIPESPADTISDLRTIRITPDPGSFQSQTVTGPINLESLGINTESVLSSLTPKPPEKYKFRRSVGQGGMKVVIQVKDRDTTRDIAMAILPDAKARPKEEIVRFIEEARITASLEHPNIVPVHDIGVDSNGTPYFTMKLLKGETLASVLRKLHEGNPEYLENYTLYKLLRIFVKICNGIAFAHSKGVIHLDLKPENIQLGDFGEVIIMDWGLAKVIEKQEPVPSDEKPRFFTEPRDGVRQGTPGYMAPEQAAGKNSEQDCRTDVYALGAILYAMLTYENPLHETKIEEMIRETIQGDIIPPSKRTADRQIPSSLEAVVMKAMALQPENRYRGAKELRNEVLAFMSGYATSAERATPLKKIFLFLYRHRFTVIPGVAVFLLLIGIMFYAFHEISNQYGDWIKVFQRDFTRNSPSFDGISFRDVRNRIPVSQWDRNAEGLVMPRGEWLWLSETAIPGNVRVEVKVLPATAGAIIEIALNAKQIPMKKILEFLPGYTLQVSSLRGTADQILKKESASHEIVASTPSSLIPGEINSIVFERDGENIIFSINGKKQLSTDLFPLKGRDFSRIGIRSIGTGMTIRSIEVFRLALPVKASPVIAGDALLETRHFEDAIDKYLTIADDYIRGPIAEHALAKAYAAAANFIQDAEKRSRILIGIKRRIAARFTTFAYHQKMLEIDAVLLWKNGDYSSSLTIIDSLFSKNPDTGIIKNILQLPHFPLPDYVLPNFMMNISRTRDLTRLDISGYGIRSLSPLANMRLTYLNCAENRLTGLNGIEGMPLQNIQCGKNQISSLEPLNGMPLQSLYCEGNPLESLRGPDFSKMIELNCSATNLENLKELQNAGLERLFCRDNRISDLSPLRGMPLRLLDAGINPLTSIEPLRGMPLEALLIDETMVSDLSPIQSMPLVFLNIWQCPDLADLSILAEMDSLETLSVSEKTDFKHPRNLKNIYSGSGFLSGTGKNSASHGKSAD